jgi:hypothetical protein
MPTVTPSSADPGDGRSPFFDFTLRVSATSSTLVISVPPDATPVLDTFADLAGGRSPDDLS